MKNDIRILIGQRGWVWVGYYIKTGSRVTLGKAKCIRKWGTTKGLGELVNGPLSSTTLDDAGSVEMHELAVIATLQCDAKKWASCLS